MRHFTQKCLTNKNNLISRDFNLIQHLSVEYQVIQNIRKVKKDRSVHEREKILKRYQQFKLKLELILRCLLAIFLNVSKV
jgi:hypothetical protein